MAIKIATAAQIAEKWARVTPMRSDDYKTGVEDPAVKWAEPTKASEERYKSAVIKAAGEGRFGKGVAKATDAKWKERVTTVGPTRWSEGVSVGGPAYQAGFAPMQAVIASLTLPDRFPSGDDRNYERSKVVGRALNTKKIKG